MIDDYIKNNFYGVDGIPNIRLYNPKFSNKLQYFGWDDVQCGYSILPELTVGAKMMFGSGVLDDNMKQIFPGDILKIKLLTDMGQVVKHGVVRKDGTNFGIDLIQNREITDFGCYIDDFIIDNKEVIGNIFENKDMIEKL